MILLLLASAFISIIMKQFDDAISITCVIIREFYFLVAKKILFLLFKKAILIVVTVAFLQVFKILKLCFQKNFFISK